MSEQGHTPSECVPAPPTIPPEPISRTRNLEPMTTSRPLLPEDIIEAMLEAGLSDQVEALRDILTDAEDNKVIAQRVRDTARLSWAVGDGVFDGLAFGPPINLPYSTGAMKECVVDSVTEYLLNGTLQTVPVPLDPEITPGVFPIYDQNCVRCAQGSHTACQQAGQHDVPGQREPVLEWEDPEGLVRYYTNGTVSFHDTDPYRDRDYLTEKERAVLEERYATWPADADVSVELRRRWDLLAAADQRVKDKERSTQNTGRFPAPGVKLNGTDFPASRRRPTSSEDLVELAKEGGETTWTDPAGAIRYWSNGGLSVHDTGAVINDDGLTSQEGEALVLHYQETVARRDETPEQRAAIKNWLEARREEEADSSGS